MKKVKVISRKNLPVKLPILSTAVAYLLLDKFNAADWVWGIVGTLYFIFWVLCICVIIIQDNVNLFEEKRTTSDEPKLSFKERVEKLRSTQ